MLLFQAIVEQLETEEQIRAAEQIFENFRNAMFQVANNILDNTHDAEEAVKNKRDDGTAPHLGKRHFDETFPSKNAVAAKAHRRRKTK